MICNEVEKRDEKIILVRLWRFSWICGSVIKDGRIYSVVMSPFYLHIIIKYQVTKLTFTIFMMMAQFLNKKN